MSEICKVSTIWAILSLICIGVQSAESENAHTNPAIKDLSIVDAGSCNEPSPAGILEYLKNTNTSKTIIAKLEVTDSSSAGNTKSYIETYTVPPNGKVELGCTRTGGGMPIVVETSWEIRTAKYK